MKFLQKVGLSLKSFFFGGSSHIDLDGVKLTLLASDIDTS